MRIPRTIQLFSPDGYVHKFWRCHNREYYLRPNNIKELYFRCLKRALKFQTNQGNVLVHAYCAMDNHFHQINRYKNGSKWLSIFMRNAHSLFGRLYNDSHQRSGKVSQDRPKTPLIESDEYLMKAHFYVESNPIRARMFTPENLKLYKFSSFSFYAFGRKNNLTEILTPPRLVP